MRFPTISVAKDASESAEIDLLSETAVGFVVPSQVEATTAQLSFKVSDISGGTFYPVYKDGVKLTLPITVSTFCKFEDLFALFGVRFLKIVLETSAGVAVVQSTAGRTFKAGTVTL